MGMTNEQFDAYKKTIMRMLQLAEREIEKEGKTDLLKQLIKDFEEELKKP